MENKIIEALEKLVQIKNETIKELEKQIQLLKNQSVQGPINIIDSQPQYPNYNPNPFVVGPTVSPFVNPLSVPYVITSVSGDTIPIAFTGDPLPLGSIQSATNNTSGSSPIQTSGYIQTVPNTNSNIAYIQKTGC